MFFRKRYKGWAYQCKSNGRILAFMNSPNDSELIIGAVYPGQECYYEIIIGFFDSQNNAKTYLRFLKSSYDIILSDEEEFQFTWDDVKIVKFKL